jgi:Flp pilus assembly protein TadD
MIIKNVHKQGNFSHQSIYYTIIFLLTIIAFSPSLNNSFTNWDDNVYITENPDIRNITPNNLIKIFSSQYQGNYQPLTMLVYMVQFTIFQLNPTAYHCTNLIIHILNSLLVFALLLAFTKKNAVSLIGALFFAIHPLRVESVAWIAELKDVLSAFFYLLSLLFFVLYQKDNAKKYYLLCAGSLLFSLLSKPMAVSQPIVLLLIDYLSKRKFDYKLLVEKIPFVIISGIFVIITLLTQKIDTSNPGHIPVTLSLLQRICLPFYGILFYFIKSVFPVKLCALYPFSEISSGSMNVLLLSSVVFFAGCTVLIYRFRSNLREVITGLLFFIITALPILQIVPVGGAAVAERYTYIPSIGISFIIAVIINQFVQNKKTAKKLNIFFLTGTILVLTLFSILTWNRCRVWKDSISLWSDVISKHPYAMAFNNRGITYGQKGDFVKALDDFNNAIKCRPSFALAWFNRAILFRQAGILDRAIEDNSRAIQYCPNYTLAYYYRAISYCMKGDFKAGIDDLTQTIMLDPKNGEAYYNRGLAYEQLKEMQHAAENYSRACELGYTQACTSQNSYH